MTTLPAPETRLQLTRAESDDIAEGNMFQFFMARNRASRMLAEIKRYNIDATRLRLPKVIERVDVLDADGVVLFHV